MNSHCSWRLKLTRNLRKRYTLYNNSTSSFLAPIISSILITHRNKKEKYLFLNYCNTYGYGHQTLTMLWIHWCKKEVCGVNVSTRNGVEEGSKIRGGIIKVASQWFLFIFSLFDLLFYAKSNNFTNLGLNLTYMWAPISIC